jgi:hypothetical protein
MNQSINQSIHHPFCLPSDDAKQAGRRSRVRILD